METENEKKTIKYLDLKGINAPYEEEIKKEINQVVSSGWVSVMSRLPFSTFTVDVLFFVVSAANTVSDTFLMPSVMTDGIAQTV